jgi:hypothetical protein
VAFGTVVVQQWQRSKATYFEISLNYWQTLYVQFRQGAANDVYTRHCKPSKISQHESKSHTPNNGKPCPAQTGRQHSLYTAL